MKYAITFASRNIVANTITIASVSATKQRAKLLRLIVNKVATNSATTITK